MTEVPATPDRRALDDQRAQAANTGDRAAAGAYLADNLPRLLSMARWIANGVVEPEDLASEAITGLLGVWAQGTGPTTNPNTYVARSMRNRVIDEYRSPRSRVRGVENLDRELPAHLDTTRDADLHREYRHVLTALASLPADQQFVLKAVVVDGRKPGELEAELKRPASAIYSLMRRAKVGLRRATLRVVLEEDAPERCRRAAKNLPESVTDLVEDAVDSRGMSHIRSCARCRAAWGRFGGMSSLLGVVTVLVVGQVAVPSDSAHADEVRSPTDAAPRSAAPRGGRSGPRPLILRVAAFVAVATGALLIVLAFPAVQQFLGEEPPAAALRFSVVSKTLADHRAQIDVDLDLRGTEDVIVDLRLPEAVRVIRPPEGWACGETKTGWVCETSGDARGTFVLFDSRADEEGDYRLGLRGHRGDRDVAGAASGGIRSVEQTVTAVVD